MYTYTKILSQKIRVGPDKFFSSDVLKKCRIRISGTYRIVGFFYGILGRDHLQQLFQSLKSIYSTKLGNLLEIFLIKNSAFCLLDPDIRQSAKSSRINPALPIIRPNPTKIWRGIFTSYHRRGMVKGMYICSYKE